MAAPITVGNANSQEVSLSRNNRARKTIKELPIKRRWLPGLKYWYGRDYELYNGLGVSVFGLHT